MEELTKKEIEVIDKLVRKAKEMCSIAVELGNLKSSWDFDTDEYNKKYTKLQALIGSETPLLEQLFSERSKLYIDYIYDKYYNYKKNYENNGLEVLRSILYGVHPLRTINLIRRMNMSEEEKKANNNFINLLVHYIDITYSDETFNYEQNRDKYKAEILLARDSDDLFKENNALQIESCEGVDYTDYMNMFYTCYDNINIADFHFEEDDVIEERFLSSAIFCAILAMLPEEEYIVLKEYSENGVKPIEEETLKEKEKRKKEKEKNKERDEKAFELFPELRYIDSYVFSVRTRDCFIYTIKDALESSIEDRKNIKIVKPYEKNKS